MCGVTDDLVVLNRLVISMSVATIVSDIGGTSLSSWLITAQMIGLLVTLPVSGILICRCHVMGCHVISQKGSL
jgi:MFS family permease